MIRRTLQVVGAVALLTAPAAARAQDPTRCGVTPGPEREVVALSFSGNVVFRDAVLANGIITEPSSWARRNLRFFGRRRCLDQRSFEDDVIRVHKVYALSGYTRVTVDTVVRTVGPGRVEIAFTIHEGPPMIVDSLRITGLESVPERDAILKRLPILEESPPKFDQYAVQRSVDTITRRLRDHGYPAAEVFRSTATDTALQRATVALDIEPGTRARFGDLDIRVTPLRGTTPAIAPATVRRLLGVKEGDPYRESRLQRAKLNLYRTEAYRGVTIAVDSADVVPPGDSLVTIHVDLAEGAMHSARVSGGWGTLDCFRTDGQYRDNNFLSTARRFEARARLSKIGIGRPLSGAAALCPNLRSDPYSEKLNYELGLTFSDPTASLAGFTPSLTLFTERRGEYRAFLHSTLLGGLLNATRQSPRTKQTIGYQAEYGKTDAQPAIFCALQNICLAEDRDPLLAYRWLATVSWAGEQTWSNDPLYPTTGGAVKVELRHASKVTGSDPHLQFSKATGDFSLFFLLGKGVVLTPRVRLGAVVGPAFRGTSNFVPPEERIFAGGSNTLRGFAPNDLGPKVYIARGYDTVRVAGSDTAYFRAKNGVAADRSVPTGGSALVVGNLELRVPFPGYSQYGQLAAFVDAGELWNPGAPQREDRFRNIKFTPGIGIRVLTVIGAFRMDVAYNPYASRSGAAFFDTPLGQGGQLYCVSPGNTLAVTNIGALNGSAPVQAPGSCVTDFQPPSPTGFLRRLRVSFGIGQAF